MRGADPGLGRARSTPRVCYDVGRSGLFYNGFAAADVSALEDGEGRLANRAHMILLVDDDDDVRETSADMLSELGYEVVQASSGYEALQILDSRPELEVMVTDIRMPGMTGLELSEVARSRRDNLKIILVSGYFTPQTIQSRFLQKPFRTHDLDQAIQAELAC